MIKLAANLSTMFTDLPLRDRFAAARNAQFTAVELMFPYELGEPQWRRLIDDHQLEVVLFNTPSGDWASGDRGLAAITGREMEFREGVKEALRFARPVKCRRLHVMAGKPSETMSGARKTLIDNVAFAADLAAKENVTVLLEAINTRVDIPGYFYDRTSQVAEVIAAVDRPNVRLQYDAYHMQIMEGDLARTIEQYLPLIGHIQIAGNPGRHEPSKGEIDYEWLLSWIDELGYSGFIGCEYFTAGNTLEGLAWAQPHLAVATRPDRHDEG